MKTQEALIQLRDDIKTWVANNLNAIGKFSGKASDITIDPIDGSDATNAQEEFERLNSNLQAITNATTFGVPVDISEYTTDSPYIAPCNGYIRANSWGNANRLYYINGLVGTIAGRFPTFVYVIKGMKLAGGGYVESTNVLFYPLE